MEQKPKTNQFALTYGLILAGIGIVFSLILHFMDLQYDQSPVKSIVGVAIMLGVLITAIYQFKKANGGYLSLSEALKVGIGAAVIAGVISAIYTFLYANFIDPDFMTNTGNMLRTQLQTDNPELTAEQIDTAVANQKKFFWITYPVLVIFNLFIGFIISLVAGLILKKEQSDY